MRVLVVDDAHDVIVGLVTARYDTYDVVVLDIMLPGIARSADLGADERSDEVGEPHRQQPADHVAEHRAAGRPVAEAGARPSPVSARARPHGDRGDPQPQRDAGESVIVSSGSIAPTVKATIEAPGGVPGVGELVGVDAELDVGVRGRGRRAR